MRIAELFDTPVSEKIEPVIKVGERGDAHKLALEIGSYVVTPMIEKYLEDILEHFTDTFLKATTEIGIWISGYFGSGKSHFAKIVALIAENSVLDGVPACKRFEARVPSDAPHRDSIVRSLGRMDQCSTQVLAFNLNTLSDSRTRPLASLLLSQYYLAHGYSGNLLYARVIEAELDKQGKLPALHAAVEARAKKPWAEIQKNLSFYRTHLYAAACEVASENFPDVQHVEQSLRDAERGELRNVVFLVDTILADLKKREEELRKPQRLMLVLDESGQWIEDDQERLSQLQALVEEAAVRGQGKVWLIVTTHGDMGAIYKEARAREGDMKKIEGRFFVKPALTTENIELVLEDRLFRKKLAGTQAIDTVYDSRAGVLRGLGELANTSRTLTACSQDKFSVYYPFFPYQVGLIPEIVKCLRSKGGRGEQMSGSTRTLLAITQDVLRAGRRKYLDESLGALVSFDEVYANLAGEGEITPDVRTELSRIKDTVRGATPLTPRVAEVLFLIREVSYIPRTRDNIARLLVESVEDDLTTVLARVQPELDRLIAAGLVARIGEEYEFLTGERRTFEEEVTTVEQQHKHQDRERGLADNFVHEPGKSHWRTWLVANVVSYHDQEFAFKLRIDDTVVPGTQGAVELKVYTPLSSGRVTLDDLEGQSLRPDEQYTLFFHCGRVPAFDQELTRYLAMKEVIGNWAGDPHKSEEARELARSRETDDLPKLHRKVVEGLKDAYLRLRAGVVERNSFRSSSDRSSSDRSSSDRSSSDRSSSDPAPPPPNGATARCTNGMNSVLRQEAVAEFVRETAYTWANRLLALRCMEARELIDEVILQKPTYGGRSLEHHRLAQRQPEACAGEDDGLLAVLDKVFAEQAQHLPMLFDPAAPGVALKPSASAIKRCMAVLSNSQRVGDDEVPTAIVFKAPDAFGWAYQYWNTEEKDRVFEKVRTEKGAKIEGADIIPATQLYTEPYMVKFLVQNSLGATWMGMYPDSKLCEKWEYYVHDADRVVERNSFRSCPLASPATAGEERNEFRSTTKPVAEITFLDPACGSGHFLLEAFDLFYDMYVEEGQLREPQAICRSILENNLFGIDIDARAVQIAEVAVWMKAAERAFGFEGKPTNLVAAVASHLKGPLWNQFLSGFEREPSVARVLRRFGQAMEHIDQLGSLARPNEELRAIIHEEHATWERQVAEKQEANFLFPEMAEDKLRGQLPFHEISDGEFGERMLYRARTAIHAFTEQSRQAGTFQDQFLGHEAAAGFKLLDVLGRQYDVVAANPPYMGSKNQGAVVKRFVELTYPAGKRDVYAAFLQRCLELTVPQGRLAMVTQQSWMFLRSFAELRSEGLHEERLGVFTGVLVGSSIECLAHLGRYAFSEIGNAAVAPVVFTVCRRPPTKAHRIWSCRLTAPRPSEQQAALLLSAIQTNQTGSVFRPQQQRFWAIPGTPLCYWLSVKLLELLAEGRFGDRADIHAGLCTGHDARFTRFFWEAAAHDWQKGDPERRWFPYEKGAGYGRWYGHQHWLVEWQRGGIRLKAACLPGTRIQGEGWYLRSGWTYSYMACGSFGLRKITDDTIISHLSAGVFFSPGSDGLAALVNCRLSSMVVRALSAKMQLNESYVARIPLPPHLPPVLSDLEPALVHAKSCIVAHELSERTARPSEAVRLIDTISEMAELLSLEGISERIALEAYGLSEDDLSHVLAETGTPAGWHPLVWGYDRPVPTDTGHVAQTQETCNHWHPVTTLQACPDATRSRLRTLFEAGPGATAEQTNDDQPDDSDEDSEAVIVGGSIPVPAETFLEQLSRTVEIHPISVYWLLKEGMEQHGWRCLPEEQRLVRDRLSVVILQLLGYRWPRQIEGGETVPKWADRDGIIPLTEAVGESTMFDRVVERNSFRSSGAADAAGTGVNSVNVGNGMNSVLREFADLMGKPLDQWLTMDFFKHHTSQFKKRPIAWQIQSSKFTARTKPAFACVVYYHKLDGDLMEKIRTQYVGPLRQRWETELRGIESVAPAARSDRQTLRRTELGDLIKDVQGFNAALHSVQESGFGTAELRLFARQDALLCMKARWLRRLRETIEAAPLAAWTTAAQAAAIHEDLPDWIDSAFVHLEHHCHRIGLSDWSSPDDPAPPSLAALICQDPASLAGSAVECANRNWWSRLDEVVLAPLRREISEKKETLKAVQAELKELAKDEHDRRAELREREHDLKWEIKSIKAKLDGIIGRADSLRTTIAAWECREATTWESWLASQPMYDAISSVDGRRRPPTTVPDWIAQEQSYVPDINDGVRVNIAPLQKAGLLAADVLAKKDLDKAIAGRAEWRADERRWCREGRLPQPGWWPS